MVSRYCLRSAMNHPVHRRDRPNSCKVSTTRLSWKKRRPHRTQTLRIVYLRVCNTGDLDDNSMGGLQAKVPRAPCWRLDDIETRQGIFIVNTVPPTQNFEA